MSYFYPGLMLMCLSLLLPACDNSSNPNAASTPSAIVKPVPDSATPLPAWDERTYARDVLPPERRAAFYKRRFAELYREHGRSDAEWFEDAQQFIEWSCDYLAYRDFGGYAHPRRIASRSYLARQLRDLRQRGCDEPLIIYLGKLCDGFNSHAGREALIESQTAYRKWAENLGEKPRYVLSILAVDHVVMTTAQRIPGATKSWVRRWANGNVSSFLILLKDDTHLTPADEVEFARLFDFYAENMDAEKARVFLQHSKDPPENKRWLTSTLRGTAYLYYAWAERGGGVYAKDVERSAWPRFLQLLDSAEDEFAAALELRPARVEPAVRMITIAMGQDHGQAYEWFEKAIAMDPYDEDAYSNGIWSHRIQWARDPETIMRVARRAFAMGDYDTNIPDWGMYAVETVIDDHGNDWWTDRHGDIWGEVAGYLDRRIDQPAPLRNTAYYQNKKTQLEPADKRPRGMRPPYGR